MRNGIRYGIALLAFTTLGACASAAAQNFTWRVATYGSGSAFAGLEPQALAIAADDSIYSIAQLFYSDDGAIRISHTAHGGGALLWQADLPLAASSDTTIFNGQPLAGMVTLQNDAVVAATQYGTGRFHGQIARYRDSDGAVLWQMSEYAALAQYDLIYSGITAGASGDLVAVGSTGEGNVTRQIGHATKVNAADGAVDWSVDVDPDLCSAQPAALFFLTNAVIDSHGDVIVAGFGVNSSSAPLCIVKLAGADGGILWAHSYAPILGPSRGNSVSLRLDANDNPSIGFSYIVDSVTPFGFALLRLDGHSGAAVWAADPVTMAGVQIIDASLALNATGDVLLSASATRKYAGADGHLLWSQDAPLGGAIATDASGRDVIVDDVAFNVPVLNVKVAALDDADGMTLWTNQLTLGAIGSSRAELRASLDHSGHFVVLQGWSPFCCAESRSTLLSGAVQDGVIDFSVSDHALAVEDAILPGYDSGMRSSVLTADDAVVTMAKVIPGSLVGGYVSNIAGILVVKRAARDGRLLWQTMVQVEAQYCWPRGIALDSAGDVLVSGACDGAAVTVKLRAADGQQLWRTPIQGNCTGEGVDAVASDAADDVYVSGTCLDPSGYASQYVFKYAGATGLPAWARYFGNEAIAPLLLLIDRGGNPVVAGATYTSPVNSAPFASTSVTRLRASDGGTLWNSTIAPPTGNSDFPAAVLADTSGDIVVAAATGLNGAPAGAVALRLALSDGSVKWQVRDAARAAPQSAAVLPGGDIVVVGGPSVWRYADTNGATRWITTSPGADELNHVTIDHAGNVLAAGNCYDGVSLHLCASSLASATGVPGWRLVDTVYDLGGDILVAADGGILLSANHALPNTSPLSLLRISGAFADGIFAGGFEP